MDPLVRAFLLLVVLLSVSAAIHWMLEKFVKWEVKRCAKHWPGKKE